MNIDLKTFLRPIFRRVKRAFKPPLHRRDGKFAFRFLGTDYGGWPVLVDSLSSESVVYCFGVGTDVSFDLAVIDQFGCTVDAFDPTPRCISWLQTQDLPAGFRFHDIGLSDHAGELCFMAPLSNDFVSYTAVESPEHLTCPPETVHCPVKPLDVLMARLGHEKINLLKMDIEGSEFSVISDMISKGILPDQLCIEFHHNKYGFTGENTKTAVEMLRGVGYVLHYVSLGGNEYGFHRKIIE